MHAPRRSHALSRLPNPPPNAKANDVILASAGSRNVSPRNPSPTAATAASAGDDSSSPLHLRSSRKLSNGNSPSPSPTPPPPPSTTIPAVAGAPQTFSTPASPRGSRSPENASTNASALKSPRAMWRAPTPRAIPLPSLLPALPASHSSPRAARHVSPPLPHTVETRASASTENARASSVDGYGDEYVRLVFDSSQSAPRLDGTPAAAQVTPSFNGGVPLGSATDKAILASSSPFAARLPPVSATTATITGVQAAAVLEQLPDGFSTSVGSSRRIHPTSPSPHESTPPPTTPPPPPQQKQPSLSNCETVGRREEQNTPQPEAWWSTLDGTVSANLSFQNTGGQAQGQPQMVTQNLNDTLGRADRAAMVLSMSYPRHSYDVSSTGIQKKASVPDVDSVDAVAAAVAVLASRLTHAGARSSERHDAHNPKGGSNTAADVRNKNNDDNRNHAFLPELTASTLAHQNTLQELRETLRLTEVNMLSPQGMLPSGPTFEDRHVYDDKSNSGEELLSFDSQLRPPSHGRNVPLASIVKDQAPHIPNNYASSEFAKASGVGGMGTKRTRDALARLYATPTAAADAADPSSTPQLQTPPLQRSLSFLSRAGPSMAAPAPAVSTDATARLLPWQCEALSVATVERRYGPLEAAHGTHHAQQRRSRHTAQQAAGHGSQAGSVGARGQGKSATEKSAAAAASRRSSIASSIFSGVSLSSSIFLRELGDGEALRRSYMMVMNGANKSSATAVATGAAAEKRSPPNKSSPSRTQTGAGTLQKQRKQQRLEAAAAAEAYRREQQRLYASHLATSAFKASKASADRPGDDVLEPYMDVDYLFSTVQPKERDGVTAITRSDTKKTKGEPVRSGAQAEGAAKETSPASTSSATSFSSSPTASLAPRDALHEALQARQAMLRRHVQESPEMDRLRYKVRQWCDRTQVMVRYENGVCAEQPAAGPPRSPARTGQPWTVLPSTSLTSEGGVGGSSSATTTTAAVAAAATAAAGLALHFENSFRGGRTARLAYEYVDDPAVEHDLLMQHVAKEVEEVQRKNALHQCRQRQQQLETAMAASTFGATNSLHASCNGSGPALDRAALGTRKATGLSGNWARSSLKAEASSNSLFVGVDDADEGGEDAVRASSLNSSPLEPTMVMPSVMSDAFVGEVKKSGGAAGGGRASSVVALQSGQGWPSQQHAALCSKLQTWGAEIEESSEEEGEEVEGDVDEKTSAWLPNTPGINALVPWQGAQRASSNGRQRAVVASLDGGGENVQADLPSSQQQQHQHNRGSAIFSKRSSRRSSFRLSTVEKDLLALVLTCGSSSQSSSSASDGGLLALLQQEREDRSANFLSEAVGGNTGTATPLQSVAALRAMLRDGFGVPLPGYEKGSAQLRGQRVPPPSHLESSEISSSSKPPVVMWETLLTLALEGYDAHDLRYLKDVHALLWRFEQWQQGQDKEKRSLSEGVGRRRPEVTILASAAPAAHGATTPCLVLPLTLSTSDGETSAFATRRSTAGDREDNAASLTVDVADLFGLLAATPSLTSWLMEAQRSSPTSTWMDLLESMPAKQQQEWHSALMPHLENEKRKKEEEKEENEHNGVSGASPRTPTKTTTVTSTVCAPVPDTAEGSVRPSPSTARVSFACASPAVRPPSTAPGRRDGTTTASSSSSSNLSILAFSCDVGAALTAGVWRQRIFAEVVRRAAACVDPAPLSAKSTAASTSSALPVQSGEPRSGAATPSPPSPSKSTEESPTEQAFPQVGSTVYLPGEEGRTSYLLDMRNGYLFSALAGEDVENRLAPQLREVRRQYAEAVRAARVAAAAPEEEVALAMNAKRPSNSLPSALQQRVHVHRLVQAEQRFVSLLAALWTQELTILSFNKHVAAFNDFTQREQRRWGPLYRSSLTVAFCVCEELAEKRMENLSPDLLPFVSVVATFMGCRGGHRELRAKLPSVMVELVERAKRVRVHLDSVAWQGKRAQVLDEARAAAQLAPRRAGAVVCGLATEADVIGVPLTEVALPSLQLKFCPPLPAAEE